MKILLVEDDATLSNSLKIYLSEEGYLITPVYSLTEARQLNSIFDFIILDWMLPDGQGIDYLKMLREAGSQVPVLFLTAKADLVDRVLGLETGANDYMLKPFEPRELLARIRAHLRKYKSSESLLVTGEIEMNLRTREIKFQKQNIEATRKEFDLLALLMAHPNQVFTREELLNKVWGFENYPTTRTVDTHVLQLRQKIYDGLIQTVRGVGYRLRTDRKLTNQ